MSSITHQTRFWTPVKTLNLLNLIKSNPKYEQAFFPSPTPSRSPEMKPLSSNSSSNWEIRRQLCLEFMKDEQWMGNAAVKGLVYENEELEWIPTTLWDEKTPNPVNIKVNKLKESYEGGSLQVDTGIDPSWNAMTDAPEDSRDHLNLNHSYYFVLKELIEASKRCESSSASEPTCQMKLGTPSVAPGDVPTSYPSPPPSRTTSTADDASGIPVLNRSLVDVNGGIQKDRIRSTRRNDAPNRVLFPHLGSHLSIETDEDVYFEDIEAHSFNVDLIPEFRFTPDKAIGSAHPVQRALTFDEHPSSSCFPPWNPDIGQSRTHKIEASMRHSRPRPSIGAVVPARLDRDREDVNTLTVYDPKDGELDYFLSRIRLSCAEKALMKKSMSGQHDSMLYDMFETERIVEFYRSKVSCDLGMDLRHWTVYMLHVGDPDLRIQLRWITEAIQLHGGNCSYDKIHRRFPGERRFRVVLRHESSNTTTTAGSTSLQSEEHVTPLELAKRMDGIYRALLRNGGEPLGQPGGNGMKRIRHELPRCPR